MEYTKSLDHSVNLSREDVEEAILDFLHKRNALSAGKLGSRIDVDISQTFDEPATFSCSVTWRTPA